MLHPRVVDILDIFQERLEKFNTDAGMLGVVLLTTREYQVMRLALEGLDVQQMAVTLELSPKTVHRHKEKICAKLSVSNWREMCELFARCIQVTK